MRQELNECKNENAKFKQDLVNYDQVNKELQLLKNDNSKELKLTLQITKLKKQNSELSLEKSNLDKKLSEIKSLNKGFERDNCAQQEQIHPLDLHHHPQARVTNVLVRAGQNGRVPVRKGVEKRVI